VASAMPADPTVRDGRTYLASWARLAAGAYATASTGAYLAELVGNAALAAVVVTAVIVATLVAVMPRITADLPHARDVQLAAHGIVAAAAASALALSGVAGLRSLAVFAVATGLGTLAVFTSSAPARHRAQAAGLIRKGF
jgi:hypothetical protein